MPTPSFRDLGHLLGAGAVFVEANNAAKVTCAFWADSGINHYISISRYRMHEAGGANEVRKMEGEIQEGPWTNASDWPAPARVASEVSVNVAENFLSVPYDTWVLCYCTDGELSMRLKETEPPYRLEERFYNRRDEPSWLADVQFRIYVGVDFPVTSGG